MIPNKSVRRDKFPPLSACLPLASLAQQRYIRSWPPALLSQSRQCPTSTLSGDKRTKEQTEGQHHCVKPPLLQPELKKQAWLQSYRHGRPKAIPHRQGNIINNFLLIFLILHSIITLFNLHITHETASRNGILFGTTRKHKTTANRPAQTSSSRSI